MNQNNEHSLTSLRFVFTIPKLFNTPSALPSPLPCDSLNRLLSIDANLDVATLLPAKTLASPQALGVAARCFCTTQTNQTRPLSQPTSLPGARAHLHYWYACEAITSSKSSVASSYYQSMPTASPQHGYHRRRAPNVSRIRDAHTDTCLDNAGP
jgi:hypothetical protein